MMSQKAKNSIVNEYVIKRQNRSLYLIVMLLEPTSCDIIFSITSTSSKYLILQFPLFYCPGGKDIILRMTLDNPTWRYLSPFGNFLLISVININQSDTMI